MQPSHASVLIGNPWPAWRSQQCRSWPIDSNGEVSSEPGQQPNLMSLPRELRDKVYSYIIEHGPTSSAKYNPIPVPATCFVNRQLRRETLSFHLSSARWEFDVRQVPYGKGEMGLLKAWLSALADDARHLARFKIICQLKNYRWEVFISLVADDEGNGAQNADVDERDARGLWPGAVGIIAFGGTEGTHYRAMFPGYAPKIWKARSPTTSCVADDRPPTSGASSVKNQLPYLNSSLHPQVLIL